MTARGRLRAERLRLIVITDLALAGPGRLADVVAAAVEAGAPAVQLRDKRAPAGALFETGRALLPVVRESGALFFVNDRLDVALALGADGVHLGPDDIPVAAARRAAGDTFWIGASTDDPEVARRLADQGADYIGCGDVFGTRTKTDAGKRIGLEGLQTVADAVRIPVVAIGGIGAPEATAVAAKTTASGVAVISAVMAAADPAAQVRSLLDPWVTWG